MSAKDDKSNDCPPTAPKKPRPAKTKSTELKDAAREARLAEALRANLRRRKAGADDVTKKDA